MAGHAFIGRPRHPVASLKQQANSVSIPGGAAIRSDSEIESGVIKRKAGDRCMGKTAVNLSVLDLNNLTPCAENDFVEFFEAFDLVRAKRGKWCHWQIQPALYFREYHLPAGSL